jgi:peptide/nickel transport system substrate-binding protein
MMRTPADRARTGFAAAGVLRRTLLAAAGVAVLPLGVRRVRADQAAKYGGVLKFAVDAEPPNYDCHANLSFATLHPVAPHYSTILKFDTANYPNVEGDLAQSWTISPDRLTYTFRLYPNILFHDGSPLTSEDVKASYERIVRPPPGVVSVRRVNYAAIGPIETPDPLTVVFHLKWPEAAMLENFASEWNSIYSAARLRQDPLFPVSHVLGSGAFSFVEHVKGDHWTGQRFDRYFKAGRPFLDGYRAEFVTGAKMIKSFEDGRIMANFRFISPNERDQLVAARSDQVAVYESPTLLNLLIVFNTRRQPYNDVRIRRALSLAIDRWGGAETLSEKTVLKFVGGLLRPGFSMATPEAELDRLPGFSRDVAAARDEAKRLLAEAGVRELTVKLTNRDLPMPWVPGGDYVTAAWRAIGLTVEQAKLSLTDWTAALASSNFDAAIDFTGDYFDDPTLQLTKYVSRDLSPANYSSSTDRYLDALYIGQAVTPDPRRRVAIVREFERQALTQAYTVPLLWYNRIVPTAANVKGWNMTPSQYIGQDLADVWLDR